MYLTFPFEKKTLPYLGVSENRGTPKSSILIRFSIINHPFWGTLIFGNIHLKKKCGEAFQPTFPPFPATCCAMGCCCLGFFLNVDPHPIHPSASKTHRWKTPCEAHSYFLLGPEKKKNTTKTLKTKKKHPGYVLLVSEIGIFIFKFLNNSKLRNELGGFTPLQRNHEISMGGFTMVTSFAPPRMMIFPLFIGSIPGGCFGFLNYQQYQLLNFINSDPTGVSSSPSSTDSIKFSQLSGTTETRETSEIDGWCRI